MKQEDEAGELNQVKQGEIKPQQQCGARQKHMHVKTSQLTQQDTRVQPKLFVQEPHGCLPQKTASPKNAPRLLACLALKRLTLFGRSEVSRQSGEAIVLGRSQAAKATWRDGAALISVAVEISIRVAGARSCSLPLT